MPDFTVGKLSSDSGKVVQADLKAVRFKPTHGQERFI